MNILLHKIPSVNDYFRYLEPAGRKMFWQYSIKVMIMNKH